MSRRRNIASLAVLLFPLMFAAPVVGAAESTAHYQVVHGWPQVPENTALDEVSAVAVDSRGDVFILTRAGRQWPESNVLDEKPISKPTIFLFDGQTGALKAEWGKDIFAMPHGLSVDADDNVWVTDVALHQVFKLSHDGRLLLTLGTRAKEGEDAEHFNRPSGVAIDSAGAIYVSDGYRNNRVAKFSADGKFLLAWGTKGKEPGQFDVPHSLTVDGADRVYVVDRKNARLQLFDGAGKFLSELHGPPFVNIQDIKVGTDGLLYVVELGNEAPPDESGICVMRPDGTVTAHIGRYGNYDGQFIGAHWVAVAKDGAVYVADFEGKRVQKFVRDAAR